MQEILEASLLTKTPESRAVVSVAFEIVINNEYGWCEKFKQRTK
jgi:hypothetical protein